MVSSELVCIPHKNGRMCIEKFTSAVFMPTKMARSGGTSVGTQYDVSGGHVTTSAASRGKVPAVRRSFSVASSSTSLVDSVSDMVSNTSNSLEFQYNLLREQIRNCSEKLRMRRSSSVDWSSSVASFGG
jgi:hypothetical protein